MRQNREVLITRTFRVEESVMQYYTERAEELGTTAADLIRHTLATGAEGESATWRAKYELERAERIRAQKQLQRFREAARLLQQAPAFNRLMLEAS